MAYLDFWMDSTSNEYTNTITRFLPGDSSRDLFIPDRWRSLNVSKRSRITIPKGSRIESPGEYVVCVWYIYLHLPYESTIHVGKYTVRPMDPLGMNLLGSLEWSLGRKVLAPPVRVNLQQPKALNAWRFSTSKSWSLPRWCRAPAGWGPVITKIRDMWSAHFLRKKNLQIYGRFEAFPLHNALVGLVSFNDPCTSYKAEFLDTTKTAPPPKKKHPEMRVGPLDKEDETELGSCEFLRVRTVSFRFFFSRNLGKMHEDVHKIDLQPYILIGQFKWSTLSKRIRLFLAFPN